ncbi:MAG: response regulator [Desulfuromonas sp.]|uniref:response regulator n=1 Tax=Desulfuromonas sp. TaxID=892 RepID=UPI000CB06198|nr:response regulator [Desulfuromonas sp.]PLX84511.1 MAG: response regulator [Desulfuromonas sp.]
MSKQILAVDDSKSILQMVSFTLQGAGYQVEVAADGQAALEMATRKNYSLVITDLNMPRLNGLELIKSLRGKPQYRFTPLLMLTTEASPAFKTQGKAAGATGWLVKPFDPQQLLGVVKKVIG